MSIVIKKMDTEDEIKGKAFVAWRSWHEACPGLVSQEYLDNLTLEKCEKVAFRLTDGFLSQKMIIRSLALLGMEIEVRKPLKQVKYSLCMYFQSIMEKVWDVN